MMARSTTRSNRKLDTSMQDRTSARLTKPSCNARPRRNIGGCSSSIGRHCACAILEAGYNLFKAAVQLVEITPNAPRRALVRSQISGGAIRNLICERQGLHKDVDESASLIWSTFLAELLTHLLRGRAKASSGLLIRNVVSSCAGASISQTPELLRFNVLQRRLCQRIRRPSHISA